MVRPSLFIRGQKVKKNLSVPIFSLFHRALFFLRPKFEKTGFKIKPRWDIPSTNSRLGRPKLYSLVACDACPDQPHDQKAIIQLPKNAAVNLREKEDLERLLLELRAAQAIR